MNQELRRGRSGRWNMLILLGIVAAVVPPFIAWAEHIYLKHGEVSGKRKALYLLLYFILVHILAFGIAYEMETREFTFQAIVAGYMIRHLGVGLVCAFIVPFLCCLLFEKNITVGGVLKFGRRVFNDIRKYRQYVVRSARAHLREEVTKSYLDWLWWVIEPLCMMLIYTFVFGFVFGSSEPNFAIFVFIGLIMWTFFSRNISYGVKAIEDNRSIVTRVYLPKYMLLVSQMLLNAFKLIISFGIAFLMMLFFRVPLTYHVLWFIPLFLELFLFTFAIGTILMHYGVYVNDLFYIVGIALNMLMYLSGVFYSMERFPEPFDVLLGSFNPLAFLMNSMRGALLYGIMPDWPVYFCWLCISLVLAGIGLYTIYYNENAYAKIS